MITTIVIPISRADYIERVVTSLEWIRCNPEETNILAIVDGSDALYVKVRNLINGTKFNKRLVVKSNIRTPILNLDVNSRRRRITAIHNQARQLIDHETGYVFLVEDDTTFPMETLDVLKRVATDRRAFGVITGVELARWGTPYLGAWRADDIYDTKSITTVKNLFPVPANAAPERIDAGGMFCAVIRADLYKNHEFNCDNGLGPDVNLGLELRRLGYENYLVWQARCTHYGKQLGREVVISPDQESRQVTLTKINNVKWHTSKQK